MAHPGRRRGTLGAGIVLALAAARVAAGPPSDPERAAPSSPEAVSPPRVFAIRPASGPAAGGAGASVYGLNFLEGSTITIGGAAATGVTVADPTRIDAASPALPPGSINDVVVTVPGSTPVVLRGAWFAHFADVPPSFLFARPIEKLRRTGITTGCGGGNYCPGDSVTRAQMAVFILRGKHGSAYHPPPATGLVFDDVPKTALFADWMEEFAAEGITSGCGTKKYCPNNPVTRGEMAVFLLRARLGSTHTPQAQTGFFTDVPVGASYGKWIEELARKGVTSGCGNGDYCPNGPSTRGEMSVFLTKTFANSPADLIADDLADGDMDYETSLLYRLYALFRDPRLPLRYQTAPTSGEDSGLFLEIQLMLPSLSPTGQAALAPYLARPDDPSSPFGPASAMRPGRRPEDAPPTLCQTTWVSYPTTSHFKVHLCTSSDEAADDTLAASVDTLAESLWTPMTADPPSGMGQPLGDCYTAEDGGDEVCPGGDAKIDIYVVPEATCVIRSGECESIDGDTVAAAIESGPFVGNGQSGFILLSRERASDPDSIKSDFAHEFFHVLQFRHNSRAMDFDTGIRIGGKPVIEGNWYIEASATWAEWYYVKATAYDQVLTRFSEDFEPSHSSLLANYPPSHPYASFIWSFFSQQEKGDGSPVFNAWKDAEPATASEGITDAVDQQLPFATHFHDFAVRNWNIDLPGHPIPKLYNSVTNFPVANPPLVNDFKVQDGNAALPLSANIESLAAQYDHFDVDASVKKIVMHFDKVPASVDVDLLYGLDAGGWKLKPVDKSQPVVFCRDHDDEKVDQIIVILSNHDKTPDDFVSAQYKVEVKPSCCGDIANVTQWKAHVTWNYQFSGKQNFGYERDTTTSQIFDLSAELGSYMSPQFSGSATGTGSEHDKSVSYVGSSTFTSTQDGDGPAESSEILLTLDLQACTFTFFASGQLEVNNGSGTFTSSVGSVTGGAARSLESFTDKISGSGDFAAHSEDWVSLNQDQDSYEVGGLGSTWFNSPDDESTGGTASITWEFDPDPPIQTSGAAVPPRR